MELGLQTPSKEGSSLNLCVAHSEVAVLAALGMLHHRGEANEVFVPRIDGAKTTHDEEIDAASIHFVHFFIALFIVSM